MPSRKPTPACLPCSYLPTLVCPLGWLGCEVSVLSSAVEWTWFSSHLLTHIKILSLAPDH